MGLASRLAQLALFAHFREPELEALAACAVGRAYAAQARILRQGEPTLDIYVVDRGLVDIQRTTPYGQFTLAQLGAGQLFGETSFVDSATRSGDVVAHTQSALVALLATPTLALLERDQRVAVALYWAFWKSLSAKLRSTNDQLGRFFSQNPRSAGDKPPLAKSTTGEFRLDIAAKRSLFAEMALIDRAPRSAQARAHDGGAVVLAIPAEVVAGILDVRKISSLPLLKILCGLVAKRLREVDDKIVGWYILSGGESNQPG